MASLGGKKLAQTMTTLTKCVTDLATENDALRQYLRRISSYQSVERLRRSSEKEFGLEYEEALEMAYENVITEAKNGLAWRPASAAVTTERVPDAVSSPSEGSGPGVQSDSGQSS